MPIRTRLGRAAAVGAIGLSVAGSAVALAPSAQAATSSTTTISCSAVKVHKAPSKTSATVGIAYRKDKVVYNQWVYKKSQKTWFTRGTVTRKSDGVKIRGYMLYDCANPYKTNPAPKPPIPK
ncbi:hypothetical protein ACFW2K_26310 [Streptomyces nigra]|uniref:hypothetical protein n=1 Tax=Streptomyces nigra TaxID=1827580 RepID=UPI0036A8BC05